MRSPGFRSALVVCCYVGARKRICTIRSAILFNKVSSRTNSVFRPELTSSIFGEVETGEMAEEAEVDFYMLAFSLAAGGGGYKVVLWGEFGERRKLSGNGNINVHMHNVVIV